MKLKITVFALVLVLVTSVQACVKPTIMTSTSQPPLANTPVNSPRELFIASTSAFIDAFGVYHIVGQVDNNGSTVLNSIQLTVEIKDAAGNSLLKDENGNSMPGENIYSLLYTLAPGVSSPFDYTYDTTKGTPASFNVKITSQATGETNRATLIEENIQVVDDGSGWFYLTGKLINSGSQWAHINGLAGAVLDDSNSVLSASRTDTYTTELAPAGDALGRDRTPFEIKFPNPGGSTQWALYWDAVATDNVTDYPMEVKITNYYFDRDGSAHLVGWITNNSDQLLDSLVIGGLYTADGTVLDSSYAFVPVPVKPAAETPFSISSFGIVENKFDQASLVSTYTAQLDPWRTAPPAYEFIDLSASGETVLKDGVTWTVSGSVINSSDKNLSGATVVVMVKDTQNKLVAMEYTSINPAGDVIAPNETNTYSVTVHLDPAADPTLFTATTLVVGAVK